MCTWCPSAMPASSRSPQSRSGQVQPCGRLATQACTGGASFTHACKHPLRSALKCGASQFAIACAGGQASCLALGPTSQRIGRPSQHGEAPSGGRKANGALRFPLTSEANATGPGGLALPHVLTAAWHRRWSGRQPHLPFLPVPAMRARPLPSGRRLPAGLNGAARSRTNHIQKTGLPSKCDHAF